MSLYHRGVEVVCDGCGRRRFHSQHHTGHGARGEARERRWLDRRQYPNYATSARMARSRADRLAGGEQS